MTHSHDTATPALSVESEYVLVPREFLHFLRGAPVSSGVCCCGDEMDRHSDPMSCGHSPVDMWDHGLDQWLKQIAAAPAPNPSSAAKGGEGGAVPTLLSCPFCGGAPTLHPHSPDRMLGAWVSCSTCGLESPTETGRSVEAAVQHWNTRAALATPSPQAAEDLQNHLAGGNAMNVQNLYPSAEDLVRSRMQGASRTGYKVEVDGRAIPCLDMHYSGPEGHVSLVLDGRWEIDVPFEYAERVAWMIANANAIGQGYAHLGALNKEKPYAPEVRGGNHLIPGAPKEDKE